MARRLLIFGLVSVLVFTAVWALWPAPSVGRDPVEAIERIIVTVPEVTPKRVRTPRPRTPPPKPTKANEGLGTPHSPHVGAMQVARKIDRGLPQDHDVNSIVRSAIDKPVPVTDFEDEDVALNRGLWLRNQDLIRLEKKMLASLDEGAGPYRKYELQIGLTELYQAQLDTLDQMAPSDAWHPKRTERWQNRLDLRTENTSNRVDMLLKMSRDESSNWPSDDPATQRLQTL